MIEPLIQKRCFGLGCKQKENCWRYLASTMHYLGNIYINPRMFSPYRCLDHYGLTLKERADFEAKKKKT